MPSNRRSRTPRPGTRGPSDLIAFIDSLKVEPVARKLGLQVDRGRPPKATCPFHDDKRPSMALYDQGKDRPHFYCFVCEKRGDAVRLAQQARNLSFAEALTFAAEANGLSAPTPTIRAGLAKRRTTSGLQAFGAWLRANRSHVDGLTGQRSLDSFARARRLRTRTLLSEEVGIALHPLAAGDWWLGLDEEDRIAVVADGIVRERTMGIDAAAGLDLRRAGAWPAAAAGFPIASPDGRVAGYALRALDRDEERRWWFTPGLNKAATFYRVEAVTRAIGTLRRRVLHLWLVEGVMDALRLAEAGELAIAQLGTSLSKEQLGLIEDWAERVAEKNSILVVHFFPDADQAGCDALGRNLPRLLKLAAENQSLWVDVALPPGERTEKADPDSLLAGEEDPATTARSWLVSPAEAVARAALARRPDDANPKSVSYPPLPSDQDAFRAKHTSWVAVERLLAQSGGHPPDRSRAFHCFHEAEANHQRSGTWLEGLREFLRDTPMGTWPRGVQPAEPHLSQVLLALDEARSSVLRLEFPANDAEWDRIRSAAEPWCAAIAEGLAKGTHPSKPVHLGIWVPRDAERSRLKALPPTEELIAQHYVLRRLLALADAPAVRWSLDHPSGRVRTTGPAGSIPKDRWGRSVVSFGYIVDEDVVVHSARPGHSGIFRPYRECYRRFLDHLQEGMSLLDCEDVSVRRLDIKGFYDTLPRFAVENAWPLAMTDSRQVPGVEGDAFRWLIERAFGFMYTHPMTGRASGPGPTGDSRRGIPQGPDLSAWLANIALFKLDRAACEQGADECVYGRYVDDIILIARSPAAASRLQAAIEAEVGLLGMGLTVEKAEYGDAVPREDAWSWIENGRGHLRRHSALDVPEVLPDTLASLNSAWGGVAGLSRRDALHALYSDEFDFLGKAESRARAKQALKLTFATSDLRHSDFVQIAQRIWMLVASGVDDAATPKEVLTAFLNVWQVQGGPRRYDGVAKDEFKARFLLVAIEGLQRAVRSRRDLSPTLPSEAGATLANVVGRLVHCVRDGLLAEILFPGTETHLWTEDDHHAIQHMLTCRMAELVWECRTRAGTHGTQWTATQALLDKLRATCGTNAIERRWAALYGAQIEGVNTPGPASAVVTVDGDPTSPFTTLCWAAEALRRASVEPGTSDALEPLDARLAEAPGTLFAALRRDARAPRGDSPEFQEWRGRARRFLLAFAPQAAFVNIFIVRPYLLPIPNPGEGVFLPAVPRGGEWGLVRVLGSLPGISNLQIIANEGLTPDPPREFGMAPLSERDPVDGLRVFEASVEGGVFTPRSRGEPDTSVGSLGAAAHLAAQLMDWLDHATAPALGLAFTAHHFSATERGPGLPFGLLVHNVAEGGDGAPAGTTPPAFAYVRSGSNALIGRRVPNDFPSAWAAGTALADALGWDDAARDVGGLRLSRVPRASEQRAEQSGERLRGSLLRLFFRRLSGAGIGRRLGSRPGSAAVPLLIDRAIRRVREADTAPDDVPHLRAHELVALVEERFIARRASTDAEFPPSTWLAILAEDLLRCLGPEASRGLASPIDPRFPRPAGAWLALADGLARPTARGARDEFTCLRAGALVRAVTLHLRALTLAALRPHAVSELRTLARNPPTVALLGLTDDVVLVGLEDLAQGAGPGPVLNTILAAMEPALATASGERLPKGDNPPDRANQPMRASLQGDRELSIARLSDLTPLGWCYALAALSGALGRERSLLHEDPVDRPHTAGTEEALAPKPRTDLLSLVRDLVSVLGPFDEGDRAVPWPWGDLVEAAARILDSEVQDRLLDLSNSLGVQVEQVADATVAPQQVGDRLRVQTRTGTVDLPAWAPTAQATSIGGGARVESATADGEVSFRWSELRRAGKLRSIAWIDEGMARLLATDEPTLPLGDTKPAVEEARGVGVSDRELQDGEGARFQAPGPEGVAPADHDITHDTDPTSSRVAMAEAPSQPGSEVGGTKATGGAPPFEHGGRHSDKVLAAQRYSWKKRLCLRNKDTHLRVVVAQLDVCDSYRHPLLEVCRRPGERAPNGPMPAARDGHGYDLAWKALREGKPHEWTSGEHLPSCAEARRRRILTAIIDFCRIAEADVLVLPEYYSRPETLQWLEKKLADFSPPSEALAVLAGTTRAFRPADRASPEPGLGKDEWSADRAWQRDYDGQAVVTWLEPRVRPQRRAKIVPAMAFPELISIPHSDPPDAILPRVERGRGRMPPSVDQTVALVCAELFLTTHPATLLPAADDIARRWVASGPPKGTPEDARKMLEAFARDVGGQVALTRGVGRRSIVLLTTLTRRAEDFMYAAQSGVLSAGIATAFANATKRSGGCGSSFVAGDGAWSPGRRLPGAPQAPPYLGVTPGLLVPEAGKRLGSLDEDEQALVVVDIDPSNTVSRRPRAQMQPAPVEYVAHIPIIEAGRWCYPVRERCGCQTVEGAAAIEGRWAAFTAAAATAMDADFQVVSAGSVRDALRLLNQVESDRPSDSLRSRAKAWEIEHLNSSAGAPPPALVDWLWVPPDSDEQVDIFVPPFAEGAPTTPPRELDEE